MLGQSRISRFFVKQPMKRKLEDQQSPPRSSKAMKTGDLSPEQKASIEEKRLQALAKFASKSAPSGMGESWRKALEAEFTKDYFKKLMAFVQTERRSHTIYPKESDVYSWTKHCLIGEVKVVIIGQDPYHQPQQAHGLCFSVPAGVTPPPSLVNIYKELQDDIQGFSIPKHGNLTGWAKQGVLLLNACLTVRASQPNSHKDKGWEKFTDAVIRWINTHLDDVVFLLWGSYAQKKGACIDKKRHCVLKSVHPSPLSAYRGFLGCKHFSQANEYLKKTKKTPIDWTELPAEAS
ncbi:uncharacterized protein LOC114516123 [Dendronephthya gigantea]|uniref:uncharacterized protein LOC114516123 n=1 Tax=Dendronephthya gigantea TaxID=151771 RepID=UPI00106DA577|nr:uncharacterized protein LOC114516123 [Dendronephthya gigantea]